MNKISISPARDTHAICCVCLARNYKAEPAYPDDSNVYVQDLYDLQIGNQFLCLCPQCLSQIRAQVGRQLIHRNLPEVYVIVKDSRTFEPKIVKGTKEIRRDGSVRIVEKAGPLSENTYDFTPEAADGVMFDGYEEVQARLQEIMYGGMR